MQILGIDPGLERIGYGLVSREGSRLACVAHGLLSTPPGPLPERLLRIHTEMRDLLVRLKPDAVAAERLLFATNRTTAMDVSRATGVVLLAVAEAGLPWTEYSPPEIKLAVVGHGGAEKKQVGFMVTRLLSLDKLPKPDDVADALAVAICHALKSNLAR